MATTQQIEHDLIGAPSLDDLIAAQTPKIDTQKVHEIDKSRLMQQFLPAVAEVHG
jgi:hypothetical protein